MHRLRELAVGKLRNSLSLPSHHRLVKSAKDLLALWGPLLPARDTEGAAGDVAIPVVPGDPLVDVSVCRGIVTADLPGLRRARLVLQREFFREVIGRGNTALETLKEEGTSEPSGAEPCGTDGNRASAGAVSELVKVENGPALCRTAGDNAGSEPKRRTGPSETLREVIVQRLRQACARDVDKARQEGRTLTTLECSSLAVLESLAEESTARSNKVCQRGLYGQ